MTTRRDRKTNVGLLLFTLGVGGLLVWFLRAANALDTDYDTILQAQRNELASVGTVHVGGEQIRIPDWSWLADGRLWGLVSKQRTLATTYTPALVDSSVAHTGATQQVAKAIAPALTSLFAAAEADGVQLMLSSAYRSADTQQSIYDAYLRLYGQAYVDAYVALPGTSEHQTGLAVDIASLESDCKQSADNCSLDYEAIVWLNENADRFGFIQRYPTGKQSITGIASEAWHYRYVGTELARLLTNSGLTLDEFVQQVAPGYAR